MKRWPWLVTLVCLLTAGPLWAEFYRYRDANGVLRFTDNIADVPIDQRPKLKQYEESSDYLSPEEKAAKAEEDARKAKAQREKLEKTLTGGEAAAPTDVNDPKFVDYLNRTKVALDAEYRTLMQEKADIEATKSTLKTRRDVSQYEQRVLDLNRRIEDFNRRRDAFKANADAYNTGAKPK